MNILGFGQKMGHQAMKSNVPQATLALNKRTISTHIKIKEMSIPNAIDLLRTTLSNHTLNNVNEMKAGFLIKQLKKELAMQHEFLPANLLEGLEEIYSESLKNDSDLEDSYRTIKNNETKIAKKYKEIEHLNKRIESTTNAEEVDDLISQRDVKVSKQLETLYKQIGALEEKIGTLELAKHVIHIGEINELKKKMDICEQEVESIKEFIENKSDHGNPKEIVKLKVAEFENTIYSKEENIDHINDDLKSCEHQINEYEQKGLPKNEEPLVSLYKMREDCEKEIKKAYINIIKYSNASTQYLTENSPSESKVIHHFNKVSHKNQNELNSLRNEIDKRSTQIAKKAEETLIVNFNEKWKSEYNKILDDFSTKMQKSNRRDEQYEVSLKIKEKINMLKEEINHSAAKLDRNEIRPIEDVVSLALKKTLVDNLEKIHNQYEKEGTLDRQLISGLKYLVKTGISLPLSSVSRLNSFLERHKIPKVGAFVLGGAAVTSYNVIYAIILAAIMTSLLTGYEGEGEEIEKVVKSAKDVHIQKNTIQEQHQWIMDINSKLKEAGRPQIALNKDFEHLALLVDDLNNSAKSLKKVIKLDYKGKAQAGAEFAKEVNKEDPDLLLTGSSRMESIFNPYAHKKLMVERDFGHIKAIKEEDINVTEITKVVGGAIGIKAKVTEIDGNCNAATKELTKIAEYYNEQIDNVKKMMDKDKRVKDAVFFADERQIIGRREIQVMKQVKADKKELLHKIRTSAKSAE